MESLDIYDSFGIPTEVRKLVRDHWVCAFRKLVRDHWGCAFRKLVRTTGGVLLGD